jgi:hypothetical protein
MLVAVAIEPSGLGRTEPSPSLSEEQLKYPEILAGRVVLSDGKKFLCGISKDAHGRHARYAFSLEIDWQIWEPPTDDPTWYGWDETFEHICGIGEQ